MKVIKPVTGRKVLIGVAMFLGLCLAISYLVSRYKNKEIDYKDMTGLSSESTETPLPTPTPLQDWQVEQQGVIDFFTTGTIRVLEVYNCNTADSNSPILCDGYLFANRYGARYRYEIGFRRDYEYDTPISVLYYKLRNWNLSQCDEVSFKSSTPVEERQEGNAMKYIEFERFLGRQCQ